MGDAYDAINNVVNALTQTSQESMSPVGYALNSYLEQTPKRIEASLLWNQSQQTGVSPYELRSQIVALKTTDFEECSTGVYYRGERFLNATFVITEIVEKLGFDEQLSRVFYVVEVTTKDKTVKKEVLAERIRQPNWLIGIAGVTYDSSVKGAPFSKLIEKKIDEFKGDHRLVFYRTGWKDVCGSLDYLLPSGFIFNEMKAEVRTPFLWGLDKSEWDLKPDVANMFNQIQLVTRDNYTGTMMYLYTQIAYLATFYKKVGIPLKFVFALIGERGSLKTSLASALALGCWEDPDKKMISQFISTGAGIEKVIDKAADRILLLDDYKPTIDRTQRNALQANLELVIRLYGDEVGKTRNDDFLSDDKDKFEYRVRGAV